MKLLISDSIGVKVIVKRVMPLSSQEIFPVVASLNHLHLSPIHPQGEDTGTDKAGQAEVRT